MLLGKSAPLSLNPDARTNGLDPLRQRCSPLFFSTRSCNCKVPSSKTPSTSIGLGAVHAPAPMNVLILNSSTSPSTLITNGLHQNSEVLLDTDPSGADNVQNGDSVVASGGETSGSFGRLKLQKVKALIQRFSRTKGRNRRDGELYVGDASFDRSVEANSIHKKQNRSAKSNKYQEWASESYPSHRSGKVMQDIGSEDIMDRSEEIVNLGPSSYIEYQNGPGKSLTSGRKVGKSDILIARDSATHLRGWGNGGSMHTLKSASPKITKERKNFLKDSDFFSQKSFEYIGCSEYMIEALRKQSFLKPTHIQAMAFQPIINGESCIIANQSGSGKTLAYLAPIIQRLRLEELEGHNKSISQAPRVVILAPTAELASQVLSNCRSMSISGVPFRSMVVTGGFRQRTQLKNLEQGVDILIATPGRFLSLIKEGFLQLTNLKCAVLDEIDILCSDEDFEAALQHLISSASVATQYLFVTATLPRDIYNKLIEVFPDCKVIMGPSLHRTSPGLEEVLVDCSGEDGSEKTPETAFSNKRAALLQLVEGSPVPKTIVFCNKIETCRKVENALKRFDRKGSCIQVLPFHAAMTQESRIANMEEFICSRSNGISQILVCTDRASRGIDFVGVDRVMLFDFPRDPSEYVRRVGRTARGAGGQGKAFIFVVGKQVALAKRIIERNQKGHPLHDVPSAYELVK